MTPLYFTLFAPIGLALAAIIVSAILVRRVAP